jgi:hypothetical protein
MPDSLEQRHHRRAKVNGERFRLVEAATKLTPGVQGNRHHAIRVPEHCGAGLAHECAKSRRDRLAAIVFERMDDVLHPAVVGVNGQLPRQRVGFIEMRVWQWRDADARPTGFTHGAIERVCERPTARRARRFEQ